MATCAAFREKSHKGHKSGTYARLLGHSCAHPECRSGFNVEGHHIQPCSQGGPDAYWNLIALCRKCHRSKGVHSRHREFWNELNYHKCAHELRVLGFFLDENEAGFDEKLKRAFEKAREREKAA